jgi:hypothetical protein
MWVVRSEGRTCFRGVESVRNSYNAAKAPHLARPSAKKGRIFDKIEHPYGEAPRSEDTYPETVDWLEALSLALRARLL